jgi:ribosomal protein L29
MVEEILKLKKSLLNLRLKKSQGDLRDTSQIKKTKKQIAKLFTTEAVSNKNKKEQNV